MDDATDTAEVVGRRSTILAIVIAVVVVVALVSFAVSQTMSSSSERSDGAEADNGALVEASAEDVPGRPSCLVGSVEAEKMVAPDAPLKDVALPCLGSPNQGDINMAQAFAGKPTVLNVWAWNCAPCRNELPLLQQWAAENPDVNLATVQAATSAGRGAAMLNDLDVSLYSYQDTDDRVGPALALPRVVPITVIFYPDGRVAKMHPGEFTSLDEITATVRGALA